MLKHSIKCIEHVPFTSAYAHGGGYNSYMYRKTKESITPIFSNNVMGLATFFKLCVNNIEVMDMETL